MGENKGVEAAAGLAPPDGEVRSHLDRLKVSPTANLISVLQDVQERFGYLPANALKEISRRLKLPLSRVYGVVSFYAQFYTQPRGRHTIKCCRGTACHVKGAQRMIDSLRQTLGVEEGQSTPDLMFHLETVACLGTCFLAPVMMIDDRYFGQLTPRRVETVLNSYRRQR